MNRRRVVWLINLVIFCLLLSSCAAPPYRDAEDRIKRSLHQIDLNKQGNDRQAPPVIILPGYYVDTSPVNLNEDPAWMRRPVILIAQGMPLDQMSDRLLRKSDVNIRYDETVQPKKLINMHYSGTVKGALDTLASKTHYYYYVDNKILTWSAFETRTFDISFMPGFSSYMVGRGQNGTAGFGNAYLGSGEVQSDVNDDQYSNLQAQLSVWEDLRNSLSKLVSPEGQFMISEATTTVTLRDHPDNVNAIATYIADLNKTLSQQVAIKIEVIDVNLNQEFELGINWNAIVNAIDSRFTVSAPLATAANITTHSIINGSSSAIASFVIGKGKHKTFIDALDLQGRVHVVTNPQVVTMNNQIASIRITNDTSYVKSVSTTSTADVGTTSSIIPGTITDGYTLYVLPKIQGDNVFMQISSTLSDLQSITKQDNIPAGVNPNDVLDNDNRRVSNQNSSFVAIQTPTLSQKMFNQRTKVESGDTLIIAGYRRMRDATSDAKLFGVPWLGAKASRSQNIETLVLITPIVMK